MAKIISKRGQKPAPQNQNHRRDPEVDIFVISNSGGYQLTEEEIDHVRRVFEGIRKQLDSIVTPYHANTAH